MNYGEGFEVVEVKWTSYTSFMIKLKLIDEEDIYEGSCQIMDIDEASP